MIQGNPAFANEENKLDILHVGNINWVLSSPNIWIRGPLPSVWIR